LCHMFIFLGSLLSMYRSILTPTTIHLPLVPFPVLPVVLNEAAHAPNSAYQLPYRAFTSPIHCSSASYEFRAVNLQPFVLLLLLLLYSVTLFPFQHLFRWAGAGAAVHASSSKHSIFRTETCTYTRVLRSPCSSVHLRLQPSAPLSPVHPPTSPSAFRPVILSGFYLGFRHSRNPPINPLPAEVYTMRHGEAAPVAASLYPPRRHHRFSS
jgi:hypothetical protein